MRGTNPIDDAKATLRERMREARAALGPEERVAAARAVTTAVLSLPEVAGADVVLLFSSFGSEVPTTGIADGVQAVGKRLLLPYLDGGVMEAAEVAAGDDMVPTSYGPLEPARRAAVDPVIVEVVVAPGLAFDRRGNRLGYGAGHYDGYLHRVRPEVPRVGIGFAVQVVDEVPAGEHDERLDLLVTEAGVVECEPPRRPAI